MEVNPDSTYIEFEGPSTRAAYDRGAGGFCRPENQTSTGSVKILPPHLILNYSPCKDYVDIPDAIVAP